MSAVAHDRKPLNGIYHWKTTFDPSPEEWAWIKKHDIRRLYIRLFDVIIDPWSTETELSAVPSATTVFRQQPLAQEVVPVAFITQEAMRTMAHDIDSEHLATFDAVDRLWLERIAALFG